MESLELRALLAVTVDDQGWTNFTRAEDARTIYVSSSIGNDKNAGLTSTRPVRTLDKARSLLRDGRGDWMLLKAGDVWYEELRGWKKSGLSKDYPLLISSYGKGERPVLETGALDGFSVMGAAIHDVAVVGLLFHAHTRDPDSPSFIDRRGGYGFNVNAPVENVLVENCVFDSYEYNLSVRGVSGYGRHIGIRRNVVVDAYPETTQGEGMYMSRCASVLIEGNVFDRNGFREGFGGHGHNIYLAESNRDVYIRNNIIANAGSHGIQARGGAVIQGNLFLRNPIALLFGNGRDARPGGVSGEIAGNVFLGTADLDGKDRGWAIEMGNIKPGGMTSVVGNIIAHDTQGNSAAIKLTTGDGLKDNAAQTVGVNDLLIAGNIIYRWHAGMEIDKALTPSGGGQNGLNGLVVRDNDFQRLYSNRIISQGQEMDLGAERFQGNRYFSSGDASEWFRKGNHTTSYDQWKIKVDKNSQRVKVKYNDPERKIETYNATLGGKPSPGAFLTQARLLARRIWDRRFSAAAVIEYMGAGFKVKKIPPVVTATNLSSRNTQATRKEIFFLFDKDVSAKLSAGDLVIINAETKQKVRTSAMQFAYDKTTNRASWTFPGLKRDMLAAGQYEVKLSSQSIVDAKGTMLDGNADGVAGDDFLRQMRIKPNV
ncbi:MAG: hypothetical protein QOE14_2387 [Humisphaera sp.]|nr:hypothetical protein [Humisphaera sp.]